MRRKVAFKRAYAVFNRDREGCEFCLEWERKEALHAALFETEDGDVLLACLAQFGGLKVAPVQNGTEPTRGEKRRPLAPSVDEPLA